VGAPARRLIVAGQRRQPREELVPQEAHLAAAGKAVAGNPLVSDHPAQVLHVHLEQLGRHRGSEDGREVGTRRHRRIHGGDCNAPNVQFDPDLTDPCE